MEAFTTAAQDQTLQTLNYERVIFKASQEFANRSRKQSIILFPVVRYWQNMNTEEAQ